MSDSRPDGRFGLYAAGFAVVVFLDQVTKIWAVERLSRGDIDVVWKLRFHLARNPGASFSLGRSWGPVFGAIAAGVLVVLFLMAMRQRSGVVVGTLGVVTGGVFGNLVDRAVRGDDGVLGGHVIDFIEFVDLWPVFNIADSSIVCGVIALIILSLRGDLDVADVTPDKHLHVRRMLAGTGDPSSLLDRFDADPMYPDDDNR